MSLRRLAIIARTEAAFNLKRPLWWILMLLLGFNAWGLSSGAVRIQAGDAAVGGTKAWITSEFAVSMILAITILLFVTFFLAVATGMSVIRDEESKVGEILHATPLTPGEYIWGKFTGVCGAFLLALLANQILTIVFFQIVPNAQAAEFRGPFHLRAYVAPAIAFGLPVMLLVGGLAFAIGARWRRPILVFVLPVAIVLICGFFLWDWSPSWLAPGWNTLLMHLDPSGFRWLNETWLKQDRGVAFYNEAAIPYDLPFILSRIGWSAIGLLSVFWAHRGLVRSRGSKVSARSAAKAKRSKGALNEPAANIPGWMPASRPLPALGMRSGAPGFLRGAWEVARTEMRELRSSPGLYLFVPLILLQTLGSSLFALGPFDTWLLNTPGELAVRTMNTLTLLVCLLILFYTVESLQRETNSGFGPIFNSTPVRTGSILFGKALANALVGVAVVLGCLAGCVLALLWQKTVPISFGPFAVVWGLLLLPTFLLFASFVIAVHSLTKNRYATYGVALGTMILFGWLQFRDKLNWVGNWDLWGAVVWSDMGPLQWDRSALVLNRLFAISLTLLFVAIAVRARTRADNDAVRVFHRLQPRAAMRTLLRMTPFLLPPVVLACVLAWMVSAGFQSEASRKTAHDYWKQNIATWKDAPQPALTSVDLDLHLDPEKSWLRSEGTYELTNLTGARLRQFALTGGIHYEDLAWTLDGKEVKPEDRTHLYVFTPETPMEPGGHVTVGFKFQGTLPGGITRNGGGASEFILPSGVVLTSFTPTFVPMVGYQEEAGVEEEKNQAEPKVYPDDFYIGETEPFVGTNAFFTTKVKITAPEAYTLNSVGVLTSDEVKDGQRTVVWESDHPVTFFNVIAGKWDVKEGEGTAIYYYPGHPWNIEEMSVALDAARKYYSEWFHPYPWKRLKLSEFPALATYAQGFATNITFSEGIGFLTQSDRRAKTAFLVTAHETAHQWWGNLLEPGKGPGGNILSEGMSHYSTILLAEQVNGLDGRIEFCKRIEERYGNNRQVDSEKPMVKCDGSKPGDTTVTYDKGGWVAWMLTNLMGREQALAGMRAFIDRYAESRDHPVLQDFTAFLRDYAPDQAAYDAFVKQWYHEVVLGEYKVEDAKKEGASEHWTARAKVTNAGSGMMPVEIAATRGERFDEDGKANDDWKSARVTVVLGAGESKEVEIPCAFEPDRIVVDPDALVLQLRRKNAEAKL